MTHFKRDCIHVVSCIVLHFLKIRKKKDFITYMHIIYGGIQNNMIEYCHESFDVERLQKMLQQ